MQRLVFFIPKYRASCDTADSETKPQEMTRYFFPSLPVSSSCQQQPSVRRCPTSCITMKQVTSLSRTSGETFLHCDCGWAPTQETNERAKNRTMSESCHLGSQELLHLSRVACAANNRVEGGTERKFYLVVLLRACSS